LAERVREAMRAGLRAVTALEVSKIDARFEMTQRILMATYEGFRADEIPADLRMVLHDMRIHRDKIVDDITFRATEDFRLAMDLVEWAIEEQEARVEAARERAEKTAADVAPEPEPEPEAAPAPAPAPEVVAVVEPVEPADPVAPPAPAQEPVKEPEVAQAAGPGVVKAPRAPRAKRSPSIPPRGLTTEQQRDVLEAIAKAGKVRTAELRATLKLEDRLRPAVTRFLYWAEKMGLLTTSGQKYGFQAQATEALEAYLENRSGKRRE